MHSVRRWVTWWQAVFAVSAFYTVAKGCFVPPVAEAEIPGGLLFALVLASGCDNVPVLAPLVVDTSSETEKGSGGGDTDTATGGGDTGTATGSETDVGADGAARYEAGRVVAVDRTASERTRNLQRTGL